jgi:hypothetical protein
MMLQIPQSKPRTFLASVRLHTAAPKKATRVPASALDRAIAEHKSALQSARALDRTEQRLLKAHPHLAGRSPQDAAGHREWRRQKLALGIIAAENRAYQAALKQQRLFTKLIKTVPSSKAEVGRYARYVSLVIKGRVGGNPNPSVGSNAIRAMGGLQVYEQRTRSAFDDLYKVLLALARRPR